MSDEKLISLCKKSCNRKLTRNEREKILDSISFRLAKGINVNSTDWRGRTVLIIASSGGNNNLELVNLLLKHQPRFLRFFNKIDAKDRSNNTALILAARFGSSKIVQALIDAGANVDANNSKIKRALRRAEKHGYTETVKILRKHMGAR